MNCKTTTSDTIAELLDIIDRPILKGPTTWYEDDDGIIHVEDKHGGHVLMSRETFDKFRKA